MTSSHSIINSPQHSNHETVEEAGWSGPLQSDDEVYDSDYEPEQYRRNYLNTSASCTVVQLQPKSSQISSIISHLNAGNSRGFRVVIETDDEESDDEEEETSEQRDDASISSFQNRYHGNQCDSEEEEKEIDLKTLGFQTKQPIETIVIEDDEETDEEGKKVDLITSEYEGDAVTSSLATVSKHRDCHIEVVEDDRVTDEVEREVGAVTSAYHDDESVLPHRAVPHKENDFIGYDLVEMEESYEKEKNLGVECFKCYGDAPLSSVGRILPSDEQHIMPEVGVEEGQIDSSHPLFEVYKADGGVAPVNIVNSHPPTFLDVNSVVIPEPTCIIPEPECIIPDELIKPDSTFKSSLVKIKSEVSDTFMDGENETWAPSHNSFHHENNAPEAISTVCGSEVADVEGFENDVTAGGVNSAPTLVLKKTELLLKTSSKHSPDTGQNQVHVPFVKSEVKENMDNGRLKEVLDKMASVYLDRYAIELKKFYHHQNVIDFDVDQEYRESSLTHQLEKIRMRVKRNMRRKNHEAMSHMRKEYKNTNSLVDYPFSHDKNESCNRGDLKSLKNTDRLGYKMNLKNLISLEKSIFEEVEVEIDEKYPAIIQNLLENSSRRFSKESDNAEEFEATISNKNSSQKTDDGGDSIINLDSIKKEITDKLEVQVEEKYPQYIDLLENSENTLRHLAKDTTTPMYFQNIKQDILNQIKSQVNEICFKLKNEMQAQPLEKSLVETISSQIDGILPVLIKDSTGNIVFTEKNKIILDDFKKSILEKVRLVFDQNRQQTELIQSENQKNTNKSVLNTMQVQIDEKYPEIIRNLMGSTEKSVNDNDMSDSDAGSRSCSSSSCSGSSCSSSSLSQDSSSSSEDEENRIDKDTGNKRQNQPTIKKELRENSKNEQDEMKQSAGITPSHEQVTVNPSDNSTQCIIHPAVSKLVGEKERTDGDKQGTDADEQGANVDKEGTDVDKAATDVDKEGTDANKEETDADKDSVSDRDVETLNAVQFILDMDNAAVETESETVGEARVFENPPELPPEPRPDSPDSDNHKKKKDRSRRFRCDMCRKSFILEKNFLKHICRQFKCKGCSQSYKTLEEAGEHEQSCLLFKKRQGLFCKDCKMSFKTSQDFSLHQQVHSVLKSVRYKCSLCASSFMHKNRLEYHIVKVHQPPRPLQSVFCGFCDFSSGNLLSLKQHYLMFHSDEMVQLESSSQDQTGGSIVPAVHVQKQPGSLYKPTGNERPEILNGNSCHTVKLYCDPCKSWFDVNSDEGFLNGSFKVSTCPRCGRKYNAKVVERGYIVKPTVKPIEPINKSQGVSISSDDQTDDEEEESVVSNNFKTKVVTMPSGERMLAVLKPLESKQNNVDISKRIASSMSLNLQHLSTTGVKGLPDTDVISSLVEKDSQSQPVEPQQNIIVHKTRDVINKSSIVHCGNQSSTNYSSDLSARVNNLEADSPNETTVAELYLPSEAPVTELDSVKETTVSELHLPNGATVAALYLSTEEPVVELDLPNDSMVALYLPTEAPVAELDSLNEARVTESGLPSEIANIEITLDEDGEMKITSEQVTTFSGDTLPVNSNGENLNIPSDPEASMPLSLEQLRFIMGNRIGCDKSELNLVFKSGTDLNDCGESNVGTNDAHNGSDMDMEDPLPELLIFKDKRFGQVYTNNHKGEPKSNNSLARGHQTSSIWLCGKCGKSFKQMADLKLHHLLNYMCHVCKREFDDIYQVRKHMNEEHPAEDNTAKPDDSITLPQSQPEATNLELPFPLQISVDLNATEKEGELLEMLKRRPLILRKRTKSKEQIFRHQNHVPGLSTILKTSNNKDSEGSLLQPQSNLIDLSLQSENEPTDSSVELQTNQQRTLLESKDKQNSSPPKAQEGCKDLSDTPSSDQMVSSHQLKSIGPESHLQTHEEQSQLSLKRPNNKNNLSHQVCEDTLKMKKRCVQKIGNDQERVIISLDFDLEEKSNELHQNRFCRVKTNNKKETFRKGKRKVSCNDETCETERTSQGPVDDKLLPDSVSCKTDALPDIRRSLRKRKYVYYGINSDLEEGITSS